MDAHFFIGDDLRRDHRLQLLPEVRSARQDVARRRRPAARQEQELLTDRSKRHLLLHLHDWQVPSRRLPGEFYSQTKYWIQSKIFKYNYLLLVRQLITYNWVETNNFYQLFYH